MLIKLLNTVCFGSVAFLVGPGLCLLMLFVSACGRPERAPAVVDAEACDPCALVCNGIPQTNCYAGDQE